ncbi:MAG: hypothetical protein J0I09_00095 [Sphingobacteriia bacterium]|nr:hypothetical protein [Sphingobacteriia bacterium]
MKRFLIVFFLTLTNHFGFCQQYSIQTKDVTNKQFYVDIDFLSSGEISWTKKNQNEDIGLSCRLLIVTSEVYDNLIIEKIAYTGSEGAKKIISTKMVDRQQLVDQLKLKGENIGLEFNEWLTWNSVKVTIQNKKYIIKDIDKNTIKINKYY